MDTNISERLLLDYTGPFGIQIISGFAKFMTDNTHASEAVRKKLYSVFIELAQNVALYSAERFAMTNEINVGVGQVNISTYPGTIKCYTVNRILREHANTLVKNCQEINSSTPDILKERKLNLHKLANSQDTGAHIGLIMIYTYSGNPLSFQLIEQDDGNMYFKIMAVINK